MFAKLKQFLGLKSTVVIDDDFCQSIEEILLDGDFATEVVEKIIAALQKLKVEAKVDQKEAVNKVLRDILLELLSVQKAELTLDANKLNVILIYGVNGGGKTTTIAKLSNLWGLSGFKVHIAACDTFRAAASTQMSIWAEKTNTSITVAKFDAQDPASVAYEAVQECKNAGKNVLLVDTAGRLHNNRDLMQELTKIQKTIYKVTPDAAVHCILVLDGTTGQNAKRQADHFSKYVNLDGFIVTKLDSSSRGGFVFSLVKTFKKPILFVTDGEDLGDIKPFESKKFIDSFLL